MFNVLNRTCVRQGIFRAFVLSVVFMFVILKAQAQADYSGQTLLDKNFLGQDLTGANFSGATLNGVIFDQANLTGANFEGAVLGDGKLGPTSFSLANLTGTNFSAVKLKTLVSFQYAVITGTKFKKLNKHNAEFGPVLDFNESVKLPLFEDMEMDCEFPWFFQRIILKDSTVPDCSNGLVKVKNQPLKGKIQPKNTGEALAPDRKGNSASNSSYTLPMGRVMLHSDFIGVATSSSQSIYVSTGGSDSSSCGTSLSNACKTIAQGISRCGASGTDCSVLVGYGKYTLTSSLALLDKVSLVGGYVNGQPSKSYQSTIIAPPAGAPAIKAGSGVSASLKSFIIVGTPTTSASTASVVMSVVGTKGITLESVNVHAGTGYDASTSSAGTRTDGADGSGVKGGANKCSSDASGGNGAPGYKLNTSCSGNGTFGCDYKCSQNGSGNWGDNGGYGQSGGGAAQGNSKLACYFGGSHGTANSGGNGTAGASATIKARAASNRIGIFNSTTGIWSQVPGATGQAGSDGGGGGGGEASSPSIETHCKLFTHCSVGSGAGGIGGGGGSGGCGATGGVGGAMGGASFGIVLINSDLSVNTDLRVVGAQGGSGGDSGAGAKGGTGGSGGSGASGASHGGPGGHGGHGGDSAGGAGGNGGPSVGIVLVGSSKYTQGPTSIYPGASGESGKGGAGYGSTPKGADGQSGLAQATYQVN